MMADGNKFDLGGVFSDVIKQVSNAVNPTSQSSGKKKTTKKKVTSIAGIPLPQSKTTTKKTTTKKTTSKKSTSKKSSSGANAATSAGISALKNVSTTKKSTGSRSSSAKTTSGRTTSKKTGKIMLEINGRQIDFKTIESKAAKLGGDCYVVVNEKKIYNDDGKSVSLF